ncbi:hypothetical protein [Amphritea sp. HPY]|uniref:hypothetical protein n=1 Tax=Amphritea sp. HPY TaxID=3421652 RepID=UPI003D7D94C0
MRYAKIENGTVIQIQPNKETGFIEVEDSVVCGMQQEGDDFVAPAIVEPMKDAKTIRAEALSGLVHDFGDGRIIQVRPPEFAADESNIRNAIERMKRLSIAERGWFMADNTWHNVTAAELQVALNSAQDQGAVIWDQFFADIATA